MERAIELLALNCPCGQITTEYFTTVKPLPKCQRNRLMLCSGILFPIVTNKKEWTLQIMDTDVLR